MTAKQQLAIYGVAAGVVLTTLIGAVAVLATRERPAAVEETAAPRRPNHAQVYLITVDFVKRHLKAPKTAEFAAPKITDVVDDSRGFNRWLIEGEFDSQNGFGVFLRGRYQATVAYNPGQDVFELETLFVDDKLMFASPRMWAFAQTVADAIADEQRWETLAELHPKGSGVSRAALFEARGRTVFLTYTAIGKRPANSNLEIVLRAPNGRALVDFVVAPSDRPSGEVQQFIEDAGEHMVSAASEGGEWRVVVKALKPQ